MWQCVFVFLLFSFSFFRVDAQEGVEVCGWVSDTHGAPLVGVSVFASDKIHGTVSDMNGYFEFRVPLKTAYLNFSFVGMESRRVPLRDSLHVILRESNEELDETLVVAFGKTRRSTFAGSVGVVHDEKFRDRALSVVSSGLEGCLAGVQTGESDGQPGSVPGLRIRGFGSVNAGNAPVYVVDGAIYTGELCDLNPADIVSMTVLKDAASTALYGSGAGNGVVLITSRGAMTSAPALHFSMKQGFSERAIPEYDRVSTSEYFPLTWEMLRNGLVSSGTEESQAATLASTRLYDKLNSNPFKGVQDEEIVLSDGQLNPKAKTLIYDDLDWEKYLFRKGYRAEYNLSYQVRNERSGLYASVGYLSDKGYVVNSDLERFTGKLSGDLVFFSRLKTGLSLNVVRTNGNLANTRDNASNLVNPFYYTRYLAPIYPVYEYDRTRGEYVVDAFGNRQYDYSVRGSVASFDNRNNVEETLRNRNHFERTALNGRGYASLSILSGLKISVHLGIDTYDQRREQYELKGVASSAGRLSNSSVRGTTITANELVEYERGIDRHSFSVLLGHESYAYRNESFSGNKQDQVLEDHLVMANFLTLGRLTSYTDTYRKEGYFFRGNYNYGERYNLSFSFRRDGSSRFAEGRRWGNFWSVGGAWNLRNEKFMRWSNQLDLLKLRASYGETGNDNVLQATGLPNTFAGNYYPSQSLYNLGANNAMEPGMAFAGFGNPDLKWETQTSFDVAVEFSLWRRFSGVIEYFLKDSRDLLFDVPQVLSSGATSLWMNVGSVRNRGVELTLNGLLLNAGAWKWNLGVTATFLKNKVTQMPASQSEITDATRKLRVGSPLYNFWLKEYRGVDPETGDAQYTFDGSKYKWNSKVCYVNSGGDSLTYYSNYARSHDAGSPLPKVYGGVTTELTFKNVALSGVFAYSIGGKVYNTGYSALMYNGKYGQAFHRDILKRWQKPGDQTDVPRLDDNVQNKRLASISSAAQANAVSDRWLCKASYLNIRSVTLSYHLPGALLKRVGIGGTSIYIGGENLFLWSAMKGLDPRQLFKGVISVSNTPARTFTLGVNLTL